jgi:hypothetical protein
MAGAYLRRDVHLTLDHRCAAAAQRLQPGSC